MNRWPLISFKFGLILLIFSLFGCSPQPQSSQTQLEAIKERGVLRVGTLFGATTYIDNENGPSGIEYELAKGFADYLSVKLEIVPAHHEQELIRQLKHNEIDVIAAAMVITDPRKKSVRFGPIYYQVSQKLVFKKGTKWPRSIEQVDGRLMVVSHSAHASQLAKLKLEYPDLVWQESDTDSSESLLMKVLAGEIDYTIVDSTQLDSMRRYHPELFIAFSLTQADNVAWGFTRTDDDTLYALAIEFFSTLDSNNQLAQLKHKYFSHIDQFDYVDTRSFIRATQSKLKKYQPLFMKYGTVIDWKLLAAISYQESHWNPKAVSFTGVRGLMMLTKATAEAMNVSNRLDPTQSIAGGARYLELMLQRVPKEIAENERIWFALAAYNVGFGHVMDAIKITEQRGGNKFSWLDVEESLPLLRKRQWYSQTKYGYARGEEPVRYVSNIKRYHETLLWLERQKMRELQLNKQQDRFSNITEIMQDIEKEDFATEADKVDAANNAEQTKAAGEDAIKTDVKTATEEKSAATEAKAATKASAAEAKAKAAAKASAAEAKAKAAAKASAAEAKAKAAAKASAAEAKAKAAAKASAAEAKAKAAAKASAAKKAVTTTEEKNLNP